jgi:hypothetical protein
MFGYKKVKDLILYKMGRFLLSNKTFNIVYKINIATCFKAYSLVFAAKELLIDYNKRVQSFRSNVFTFLFYQCEKLRMNSFLKTKKF